MHIPVRLHYKVNSRKLCTTTKPLVQRVRPRALTETFSGLATSSYFTGKFIILFTMFYTSLNYWHYRSLREQIEKEHDDQNHNKK